ncbi:3-isopropylmalate dehydratase small subunit [Calditerrivibrio nitroreducens]|uniref:3-isopropylmalate dehydratase small subunit n=1 Tax=Calditerrivibrio nitroreducens (strain DSM 19672 / NBRC 101217 / Yu37-1) TaxID=768670 RepID=E4THR8_CALNY|nr:3-isopropylmalate dehydratase small subunit [Calditerrivibrio nitroreducens]ADR19929.1 3-isopropylmalate dehydratase, small subunit [Calditerrivibrio nitroreducens DSM 19672]
MGIDPIKIVKGRIIPILGDDIDTDRIIPARYLKCVTFDGIGEFAFYDERFENDGTPKNHPMNDPKYKGANIILSGNNFGCGSSREHAPQSIKRAGFQAIIAESFAEIFYGNSLTLGIVCATLPKEKIKEIAEIVAKNPSIECTIDVENKILVVGNNSYSIDIKESARKAFIDGTYDSLGELLKNIDKIRDFEKGLKYRFL